MLGILATTTLFFASAVGTSAASDLVELHGSALGTNYSVKVASAPAELSRDRIAAEVRDILDRVDRQMSTYRPDSELERFNRSRSTDWIPVSDSTVRVTRAALEIAQRSGGAFDPTVGPLVELWGFGPGAADRPAPDPGRVATLLASAGASDVEVRDSPPALRKRRPMLELDLSAIAKGFATDQVVTRLRSLGAGNVLVDVGGELRGSGRGAHGGPWVVAIEDPFPGSRAAPVRVRLDDHAVATSGAYRNFRVAGERRLPHVLDPRTGAPVENDLVSVSVLASTAMEADAWSTALLVAGSDAGWALAQREGLAALFVNRSMDRRATARFRGRQSELPDKEERR